MKRFKTKTIILGVILTYIVIIVLVILSIFTDIFPNTNVYYDTVEEAMDIVNDKIKSSIDTIYLNEGALYVFINENGNIVISCLGSKVINNQTKYYRMNRGGYDIESIIESKSEPLLGTYSKATKERKTKLLYGWKNKDGKVVHVNEKLAVQKDFSVELQGKNYELSLWYIEIDLEDEVENITFDLKE